MRRVDPIKAIEGVGCQLIPHGGRRDWYRNPITGASQPVPRHREINERLARRIVRMLSHMLSHPSDVEGAGIAGDA